MFYAVKCQLMPLNFFTSSLLSMETKDEDKGEPPIANQIIAEMMLKLQIHGGTQQEQNAVSVEQPFGSITRPNDYSADNAGL